MDKDTYNKINNYCITKCEGVLVQTERDYILSKFLDSYYESLDNFVLDNGRKLNKGERKTITSTILNKNTFLSYTDSAKNYYIKFKGKIEEQFSKKQDKSSLGKSTLLSMLANLLYSIALIKFFI